MNDNGAANEQIDQALKLAASIAEIESEMAERHLKEANVHICRADANTKHTLQNLSKRGPLIEDLRGRGLKMAGDLQNALANNIESIREDLAAKRKSLSRFTVTLFGRTQAGKSTIREAITRGSGETIGKGAQRTTRAIREYEWNRLTIFDTPGIAAYRGEGDEALAYSVINTSDVVLFLLTSDSIQLEEFEAMARIQAKNKPILFVLNVKSDLTHPILLKRALKDDASVYDPRLIDGCRSRIRTLAVEWLDVRNPEIIEVHAQSAFLSTRPENENLSKRLYSLSHFQNLEKRLLGELTERGTIRRLQTIYDATIVSLGKMPDEFTVAISEVQLNAKTLDRKVSELDDWFRKYKREMRGAGRTLLASDSRIRNQTREWLSPLRTKLPHLIEKYIEDSNLNRKIRKEFGGLKLNKKADEFAQSVESDVKNKISDLLHAMEVEIPFMRSKMTDDLRPFKAFDTNRMFGRIAAGASVLGGVCVVAGMFSASNFWNPAGWVAAGVAILTGLISFLGGDHDHKRRKAVAKAQKQAGKKLDELEVSISRDLEAWFDREIEQKALQPTLTDSRAFCDVLTRMGDELQLCRREIHGMVEKMNRRLLSRGLSLAGAKISEFDIVRVARLPGNQAKFTYSRGDLSPLVLAKVEDSLQEWINPISSKLERSEQVAQALRPAKVLAKDVHAGPAEISVFLPPDQFGLALGKGRKNHYLACQLFRTKIKLVSRKHK